MCRSQVFFVATKLSVVRCCVLLAAVLLGWPTPSAQAVNVSGDIFPPELDNWYYSPIGGIVGYTGAGTVSLDGVNDYFPPLAPYYVCPIYLGFGTGTVGVVNVTNWGTVDASSLYAGYGGAVR